MNGNSSLGEVLVVLALIVGMGWYLHWSGYESGKADANAALNKATDANASCVSTIESLKLSLGQCEIDRTVDATAQAKALADRNAEDLRTQETFKTARDQLQKLMQGQCSAWAKAPACGSYP